MSRDESLALKGSCAGVCARRARGSDTSRAFLSLSNARSYTSLQTLFSSSFPIFTDPFTAFGNTNITLVVSRLAPAALTVPSSARMRVHPSSLRDNMGTCVMTSIGDMSPAITHNPSLAVFQLLDDLFDASAYLFGI